MEGILNLAEWYPDQRTWLEGQEEPLFSYEFPGDY